MNRFNQTIRWLGVQSRLSASEQVLSALGGFLSLVVICGVSYGLLGLEGVIAVVPSMGAATVLIFASPHAPQSQPWALFVGNLISAVIGVTCALFISMPIFCAGLAVGLAIGAMAILRCVHPPGGATSLTAVMGGQVIHDLGYTYVLIPVLLNCCVIFLFAVLFNNLFGWRGYPAASARYQPLKETELSVNAFSDGQLEKATQDLEGLVDVSPAQLRRIFHNALQYRDSESLSRIQVELGGVYSNNKMGALWEVRKIVDYGHHPNPNKELIIYKVLEGPGKNKTGSCGKIEFSQWANQRIQPAKKT